MEQGQLSFLKKMIERGYFRESSFYSGIPSTTPAVQAEVMYGVKCAVPAFQFLHLNSGQVFRMFEHDAARTIVEERLTGGEPLLKDGASFSNIYSGGAKEARCCAETTTLPNVLKNLDPLRILAISVLYFFTLLRICWLALLEVVVATWDMFQGILTGRGWQNEIRFVPERVAVSIVLREWIRIAVKVAVAKGTPVIYANFLGYDEQAHLRGPSAAFAHWGLKGIDGVAKDLFKTMKRSDARDYELIVFSDHGQEDTRVYDYEYGQTIQDAVKNSLRTGPLGEQIVRYADEAQRGRYLDQRMRRYMRIQRGRTQAPKISRDELANQVVVTAMGPTGHIYFPTELTDEGKADCAKHLVEQEHVPLVIYRTDDANLQARNSRGLWDLEEDILQILGENHHFVRDIKEDVLQLCASPNVGDLVICGWDPDQQPLTFVQEHGAHGSVGSQETRGIALVPTGVSMNFRKSEDGEDYVRGVDIHAGARNYLDQTSNSDSNDKELSGKKTDETDAEEQSPRVNTNLMLIDKAAGALDPNTPLRLVTYNTHHSVGMDGKCRPGRIADVLAGLEADIVALQEVDTNRHRSGRQDQAQVIAARLQMHHHFFPVWSDRDEHYGLAILSRFPFEVVKEGCLSESCQRTKREARGAVWISIQVENGEPIHVLNTHLGLRQGERLKQVDELLGKRWLSNLPSREPVILAGDFNAGPRSKTVRKLTNQFGFRPLSGENPAILRTFPSTMPLRRIDHMFASRQFHVQHAFVPQNYFTKLASDHLPLCVQVKLRSDDPAIESFDDKSDQTVLNGVFESKQ